MLPPQGYLEMLGLMSGATLVLTDSGGMQEETTALGVPCLTLRENTERPITIEQGTNTLVGRDRGAIERAVDEILAGSGKRGRVPELWDGRAAERIAAHLRRLAWRGASAPAASVMMRAPTPLLPGDGDVQCPDHRRRGLFPGLGAGAVHSAQRLGHARCRVEPNVERILAMLDEYGAHATFFTLGWIAERYPELVRRIVAGGHELASHGFAHQRASEQSPAAFFSDIQLAKIVLEDIAGTEVTGYRAPSFSIGDANTWAFECIERAGYRYSSSIYPIRHDHYGMPDAPRFAHDVRDGLLEVPVTTMRLFGRNWPAGGGGYFRLLPYAMSRWLLRRVNRVDQQPAIFYFHPWEIDPAQPRVPGVDARTRFRHYLNLDRMERRLRQLLFDFEWGRVDEVLLEAGLTRLLECARMRRSIRPHGPAICDKTMKHHPLRTRLPDGRARRLRSGRCRPVTPRRHARWDAFVAGCPGATFFHRAGWQQVIEDVFGHRTHFLYAQARRSASRASCRWRRSGAVLFGDALVSLPFAVYGGVAAEHAEGGGGARGRGAGRGAAPRRRSPRVAQRRGAASGLADAGSLRHVPQGTPARSRGEHARHSAQAAGHGAQGHQARARAARSTRQRTASSRSTPTTCTGTARRRCRNAISMRCCVCSAPTAKC